VRRYLPGAKVAVTRSLAEAEAFVTQLGEGPAPELLLSGGGDGTAVSLLNAFERRGAPMPTLGLLPLGTGNGWANNFAGKADEVAIYDKALTPQQVATHYVIGRAGFDDRRMVARVFSFQLVTVAVR